MAQPQLKQTPPEQQETPAPKPDVAVASSSEGTEHWVKPAGLKRTGWIVLGAVLLLFQVPLIHRALRGQQPVKVSVPYTDDFSDPSTVTEHYWTTGGHWRTINGELLSPGVKNNPLWLEAKLPENVAIDFDVRSESPEGDIKCEIFGDGLNHGSGYVLIHGGWNNRLSIIARLYEHGPSLQELERRAQRVAQEKKLKSSGVVETGVFQPGTQMRVEANPFPVQMGRTYHWHIERRGSVIRWSIDGQPFMEFDDPFPLKGEGHDRFGFSSWESQLYFDNLKIQPLQ